MEKVCFFLFVLFLSIKVNSQNEYVYSNADYGVEVTFPSEPEVAGTKAKYLDFFSASLSLFSNSLSYSIAIERSPFESDKITAYSNEGYDIINKSEYNLGKKNVKEYDFHYGAKYLRCKIISFKKITVELKVYS